MQYVLKKTDPDGASQYLVITPGFEAHVDPMAVQRSPNKDRATRFPLETAERWQRTLGGADEVEAVAA